MNRTSPRRRLALVVSLVALTAGMLVAGTTTASAALSNSSPPKISGKAQVGVTLKASQGTWKGQYELPVSTVYTYQWKADGVAIPDSTAKSYVLTADNLGQQITVEVTATKAPQAPITVSSTPTAPVALGTIKTDTLHIEGINKVGHTQSVIPGHWKPNQVTFTIVWQANGVPVAAGPHYTPTAAQAGTKTSVVVMGTRTGYAPAFKTLKRFGHVRP
jgi:hypothetical protein